MTPERWATFEALAGTPDADGDLWQQACDRAFAIRELLAAVNAASEPAAATVDLVAVEVEIAERGCTRKQATLNLDWMRRHKARAACRALASLMRGRLDEP